MVHDFIYVTLSLRQGVKRPILVILLIVKIEIINTLVIVEFRRKILFSLLNILTSLYCRKWGTCTKATVLKRNARLAK